MRTELIVKMEQVLTAEQALRNERKGVIGNELTWVKLERDAMLNTVNKERLAQGKQPIDAETLTRKAENQALGHYDYTHKFALYCAFLVEEP